MTKDHHKKEQWERELVNRQRNIVFPDTVRNDRLVNELLWKGSPHAARVQRIGIALIAIAPLTIAATFIYMGWYDDPPNSLSELFGVLVAVPFIYVAFRLLRNAFLRPASKSDQE
jgi:hypothetical protein